MSWLKSRIVETATTTACNNDGDDDDDDDGYFVRNPTNRTCVSWLVGQPATKEKTALTPPNKYAGKRKAFDSQFHSEYLTAAVTTTTASTPCPAHNSAEEELLTTSPACCQH